MASNCYTTSFRSSEVTVRYICFICLCNNKVGILPSECLLVVTQHFKPNLLCIGNCNKLCRLFAEYGMMAVKLKDKFDSLIEKSLPDTRCKPARPKQARETAQRVSYSEQLSETSESSEGECSEDNNNGSDSSSHSYEQPRRKVNTKVTQRRANAPNNKKVSG